MDSQLLFKTRERAKRKRHRELDEQEQESVIARITRDGLQLKQHLIKSTTMRAAANEVNLKNAKEIKQRALDDTNNNDTTRNNNHAATTTTRLEQQRDNNNTTSAQAETIIGTTSTKSSLESSPRKSLRRLGRADSGSSSSDDAAVSEFLDAARAIQSKLTLAATANVNVNIANNQSASASANNTNTISEQQYSKNKAKEPTTATRNDASVPNSSQKSNKYEMTYRSEEQRQRLTRLFHEDEDDDEQARSQDSKDARAGGTCTGTARAVPPPKTSAAAAASVANSPFSKLTERLRELGCGSSSSSDEDEGTPSWLPSSKRRAAAIWMQTKQQRRQRPNTSNLRGSNAAENMDAMNDTKHANPNATRNDDDGFALSTNHQNDMDDDTPVNTNPTTEDRNPQAAAESKQALSVGASPNNDDANQETNVNAFMLEDSIPAPPAQSFIDNSQHASPLLNSTKEGVAWQSHTSDAAAEESLWLDDDEDDVLVAAEQASPAKSRTSPAKKVTKTGAELTRRKGAAFKAPTASRAEETRSFDETAAKYSRTSLKPEFDHPKFGPFAPVRLTARKVAVAFSVQCAHPCCLPRFLYHRRSTPCKPRRRRT
jgi:hypothetical protein